MKTTKEVKITSKVQYDIICTFARFTSKLKEDIEEFNGVIEEADEEENEERGEEASRVQDSIENIRDKFRGDIWGVVAKALHSSRMWDAAVTERSIDRAKLKNFCCCICGNENGEYSSSLTFNTDEYRAENKRVDIEWDVCFICSHICMGRFDRVLTDK